MSKRIRFYTDENVPSSIVKGLRLRGIDILTTKEADLLGADDEAHLYFARQEQRIIFTQDVDFLRLHSAGVKHSGIIYAHQKTSISRVIKGLLLIHQVLKPDEMKNHVEFL